MLDRRAITRLKARLEIHLQITASIHLNITTWLCTVSLQMSPALSFLNSMNTEKEVWSVHGSIFSPQLPFLPFFLPEILPFTGLHVTLPVSQNLFSRYPHETGHLVLVLSSNSRWLPMFSTYHSHLPTCQYFHSSKSFISTIYS